MTNNVSSEPQISMAVHHWPTRRDDDVGRAEKHPEMKPKQWHNSMREALSSCRLFGRSINGPTQLASFAPHSHALLRVVCVCVCATASPTSAMHVGSLRREALFPRFTLARELFPPRPKRTRIGSYTLNEWAKSLKFDDFNAKQPQNHSNFSNRFYSAITPTSFWLFSFGSVRTVLLGMLFVQNARWAESKMKRSIEK